MLFVRVVGYLLLALVIALAGFGGAALAIYLLLPGFSDRLPLERPQPKPTRLEQLGPDTASIVITDQDAIAEAVERIAPCVVTVHGTEGNGPSASAFALDDRGYLVTCQSALAGLKAARVTLADDREVGVTVVGSHTDSDVAVLKVDDADDLHVAPLGDSRLLRPGEWVVAVGAPNREFEHTVSVGVVCARGRPVSTEERTYDNLIQTDARLGGGTAGGALVNLNGEVVGLCTEAYAASGDGAGFAVPIEDVHTLVDEMIRNGRAQRTYLGLSVTDISEADAELLGLTSRSGALVRGVLPGGPAASAGLRRHDVITRFDGQSIRSANGFLRLARKHRAGEEVSARFVREGKTRDEIIHVAERK